MCGSVHLHPLDSGYHATADGGLCGPAGTTLIQRPDNPLDPKGLPSNMQYFPSVNLNSPPNLEQI